MLHPVAARLATTGVPEARTPIATPVTPCVTRGAPSRRIQQEARGVSPLEVVTRRALPITEAESPEATQPRTSRRTLPSAPQAGKLQTSGHPSPSQDAQHGLEEGAADGVSGQRKCIGRSSSDYIRRPVRQTEGKSIGRCEYGLLPPGGVPQPIAEPRDNGTAQSGARSYHL